MNTSPDFAAMLAEITGQPAQHDPKAAASAEPGAARTAAGSAEQVAGDCTVVTDTAINTDIDEAVTDGCLGMGDRRLQRGDIPGAVLWSGLATDHD